MRHLRACVKLKMADSSPVNLCCEITVPVTGYTNANEKLAVEMIICSVPCEGGKLQLRLFRFPNDEEV